MTLFYLLNSTNFTNIDCVISQLYLDTLAANILTLFELDKQVEVPRKNVWLFTILLSSDLDIKTSTTKQSLTDKKNTAQFEHRIVIFWNLSKVFTYNYGVGSNTYSCSFGYIISNILLYKRLLWQGGKKKYLIG